MNDRQIDAQTDPPQHSAPPLSKTERKVYSLLIKRLTEREVAETLERSPNTVHVHVRNIYRKIGVRSRQELYDAHDRSCPENDNL